MAVILARECVAGFCRADYKAELVYHRGPWKTIESLELATLTWVTWFNHTRLLEPIGNIPPAEAEERYYSQSLVQATTACT